HRSKSTTNCLEGHLSNRESKQQIDQLLLDIRHSVDLEATIHAK
ncbi:hypothetical protein AAULR_24811, partial [Lacticaseibacillus rhamnosus MTCC 5462]